MQLIANAACTAKVLGYTVLVQQVFVAHEPLGIVITQITPSVKHMMVIGKRIGSHSNHSPGAAARCTCRQCIDNTTSTPRSIKKINVLQVTSFVQNRATMLPRQQTVKKPWHHDSAW